MKQMYRCPKCGDDDILTQVATAWVNPNKPLSLDDCHAECQGCGEEDQLKEFAWLDGFPFVVTYDNGIDGRLPNNQCEATLEVYCTITGSIVEMTREDWDSWAKERDWGPLRNLMVEPGKARESGTYLIEYLAKHEGMAKVLEARIDDTCPWKTLPGMSRSWAGVFPWPGEQLKEVKNQIAELLEVIDEE